MIFDASVWEFSVPLTMGASLIIARSDERNDNVKLAQLLAVQQVSQASLPPAILATLSIEDLELLHSLVLVGEACSKELVTRFAPNRQVFNAYGPTEATVYASVHGPLDPLADTQGDGVPIGASYSQCSDTHLGCPIARGACRRLG